MRGFHAILIVGFCLVGCQARSERKEFPTHEVRNKPLVYATNYPLEYFVDRVSGSFVDTAILAPEEEDPAFWRPEVDDVLEMQRADLIVLNGATYEPWLNSVALDPSRLIITTDHIEDRLIPMEEDVTHSHGAEGEHEHKGIAFTTWLDPTIAIEQARSIEKSLREKWPESASRFADGLSQFEDDLEALDATAQRIISANPDRPLLFSHPVYQYFVHRYDLNSRSVHWEPDEYPTEELWGELESILEEFPATWMIWEDAPMTRTSDRLESLGIRSAVFRTCVRAPDDGDFLSVMLENVGNLRPIFAETAGSDPE